MDSHSPSVKLTYDDLANLPYDGKRQRSSRETPLLPDFAVPLAALFAPVF